MAQLLFYRYVSEREMESIRRTRTVRSSSRKGTYWTTQPINDADEAVRRLALYNRPRFRIGPISGDEMPDFDVQPIKPVAYVDPARPGWDVEGCTSGTVYLFGVWDFDSQAFVDGLGGGP